MANMRLAGKRYKRRSWRISSSQIALLIYVAGRTSAAKRTVCGISSAVDFSHCVGCLYACHCAKTLSANRRDGVPKRQAGGADLGVSSVRYAGAGENLG
jgi:hypothetical protein